MKSNFFNLQRDADADIFAGATIVVNNKDTVQVEDVEANENNEEKKEVLSEDLQKEVKEEVKEEVKAESVVEEKEPPKDWRETATIDDILEFAKSKADRTALLKAAGVDEETIKAIDYKESNGGNWDEYLKVKNTDYSKIDYEKLIEMDLRQRRPDVDGRKFDILLKNELKKYNLDRDDYEEDSEDAIIGLDALEQDAIQIRQKFIDKQNSLKAPEKLPDTTAKDLEVFRAKLTDDFRNSEPIKGLLSSKVITFGKGDESFNYEPNNLDNLVSTAIASVVNQGAIPSDEEVSKTLKALAYYLDPEGVENALISQGKVLNGISIREKAVNPIKKTDEVAGGLVETDIHKRFETHGKVVYK
jgi:hypothetical protein